MLTELRIRNFAIIDALTLPLAAGFNVLTGETGAGKSIIVGALGFLLGERGTADLIRTGADKASVEGIFDVSGDGELSALLDERGIDLEDPTTVVLRREIVSSGRTRAWINSATTTASVLAEIGRALVSLHGQHEAQTLLDEESQRAIVDAFGGATAVAARVRAAHEEVLAIAREIQSLTARKAEAERRADYLRHLVSEIDERAAQGRRGCDARGGSAASGACRGAQVARWRDGRHSRGRRGRGARESRAHAAVARLDSAHRCVARAAAGALRQRLLFAAGARARAR